jgi:hypothetical protein
VTWPPLPLRKPGPMPQGAPALSAAYVDIVSYLLGSGTSLRGTKPSDLKKVQSSAGGPQVPVFRSCVSWDVWHKPSDGAWMLSIQPSRAETRSRPRGRSLPGAAGDDYHRSFRRVSGTPQGHRVGSRFLAPTRRKTATRTLDPSAASWG